MTTQEPLSPAEQAAVERLRTAYAEASRIDWPFEPRDVTEQSFRPRRHYGRHSMVVAALVAAVIVAVLIVPLAHAGLFKHLVSPAKPPPATSVPSRVSKRAQSSGLSAVSCSSASACTAVGSYDDATLAEAWNGTKWSVEPTANPTLSKRSSLSSVSCTSPTACTAVGSYDNSTGTQLTLAETWNGTTWAIQPAPDPTGSRRSSLSGVSCASATACTAVGTFDSSTGDTATLAETWNGSTWAIRPTPNPEASNRAHIMLLGLSGVSCTSATACTAVGGYSYLGDYLTLAEGWNGKTWAIEPTPKTSGAVLSSVSCTSAAACIAVGGLSDGTYFTRVEVWNGETWAMKFGGVASSGEPPFSGFAGFLGVSCASATRCVVVGSGSTGTLAEVWNGKTFTFERTATDGVSFVGVSCTSATACKAVGSYDNSAGDAVTLVEAWNGAKWSVEPSPKTT
jgi:hypothetical protein